MSLLLSNWRCSVSKLKSKKFLKKVLDKIERFEYNMHSSKFKELKNKIESMDKEELARLVMETLDECEIPYEVGKSGFVFHGLSEKDFSENSEKGVDKWN